MADIAAGSIVKLKSGGVLMTVESVTQDGRMSCVWFNDKKVEREIFRKEALTADQGEWR